MNPCKTLYNGKSGVFNCPVAKCWYCITAFTIAKTTILSHFLPHKSPFVLVNIVYAHNIVQTGVKSFHTECETAKTALFSFWGTKEIVNLICSMQW